MAKLIIDTGFFLAINSKTDKNHKRAVFLAKELGDREWITTWPVLTETCHLLLRDAPAQIDLFMGLYEEGLFELFPLDKTHVSQIKTLMRKYRNLPMDLADASLIILAEECGQGEIVSTDRRDFNTYKWKNRHPFCNLFY